MPSIYRRLLYKLASIAIASSVAWKVYSNIGIIQMIHENRALIFTFTSLLIVLPLGALYNRLAVFDDIASFPEDMRKSLRKVSTAGRDRILILFFVIVFIVIGFFVCLVYSYQTKTLPQATVVHPLVMAIATWFTTLSILLFPAWLLPFSSIVESNRARLFDEKIRREARVKLIAELQKLGKEEPLPKLPTHAEIVLHQSPGDLKKGSSGHK